MDCCFIKTTMLYVGRALFDGIDTQVHTHRNRREKNRQSLDIQTAWVHGSMFFFVHVEIETHQPFKLSLNLLSFFKCIFCRIV